MEQPPFYIGQEVVCVKGHQEGDYIKGKKYTILGFDKCAGCGDPSIDIGITIPSHNRLLCRCGYTEKTNILWAPSRNFAPIERIRIKYVQKEVEVEPAIKELEKWLN